MADERIVETTDATTGDTQRVVERNDAGPTVVETRSGGGGGLIIGLILLVGVAVLAFFLLNLNKEETRQTDAIEGAAGEVGEGAKQVGDAVEKAADDLTDGK